MTKILAIDTATNSCSVAVAIDNKIYNKFKITPSLHTKFIRKMIYDLMLEINLTYDHLNAIAFGCGPGSFTGVRLAASIVHGLSYATDLPILMISTLRSLAQEIFIKNKWNNIFVAQDARMNQIYFGEYINKDGIMYAKNQDRIISPDELFTYLQNNDCFFCAGNGFDVYKDKFSNSKRIKDITIFNIENTNAKYIAQLAINDFNRKINIYSYKNAFPTYLREPI